MVRRKPQLNAPLLKAIRAIYFSLRGLSHYSGVSIRKLEQFVYMGYRGNPKDRKRIVAALGIPEEKLWVEEKEE